MHVALFGSQLVHPELPAYSSAFPLRSGTCTSFRICGPSTGQNEEESQKLSMPLIFRLRPQNC